MEQIEDILKEIMKFKTKQQFSLDIYFNDLDNTFVVKIHNYNHKEIYNDQGEYVKLTSESTHFRNKNLIDSLIEAFGFCDNCLQ